MLIKIGNAWIDPGEIAGIIPEKVPGYEDPQSIMINFRQGGALWISATMDEAEAALIDAGLIEDPDETDPAAPWLGLLAELQDEGYSFLARDKDGKLFAYRHKPEWDGAYWNPETLAGDEVKSLPPEACPFVTDEDEEPFDIREVLP